MPDQDMKQLVKNSPAGILAKELSYPENYDDLDFDGEVVLIELNHFFAHHCGLPAIIRALRSEKKYRFIPYIPLVSWEATHSTLEVVQGFYECMGIEEEILKATPSLAHFEKAKSVVIENLKYFQGEIWNLTDFEYDELPIGVHLVETLLQQFKSAEFDQSISTVAYSVGLIARYLWWKEWLFNNKAKYIIASHNCYEFVLPQLAAKKIGTDAYVWHDNYLFYSNPTLPLPLASEAMGQSVRKAWAHLSQEDRKTMMELANSNLLMRAEGARVGMLTSDPRFVKPEGLNQKGGRIPKSGKKVVVIYAHAFSDAPCTLPRSKYGSLCSPLVATRKLIELISKIEADIYIKTHPKPFEQDEKAILTLLSEYPNLNRLSSFLSPLDIKNMGVDLIISGWGSVCYEAPLIGVPVVCYSSFLEIVKAELLPYIDIDNEEIALKRLKSILNGDNHERFNRDRLISEFAMGNFVSRVDLTCANTDRLEREGDSGRYSVYAFRYWADNLSNSDFVALVKNMTTFFKGKECVFSCSLRPPN